MDEKKEEANNLGETVIPVKPERKWKMFGLVFAVLILVVVLEVIWAARTLLAPVPKTKITKIEPLGMAKVILNGDRSEFKVGDVVPVKIKIATGGREVDSIDLIIHFDPKILEATSESNFSKGPLYQDYPLIDIGKDSGTVKISALTPPDKSGFTGIGTFGMLNFKAKSTGQTKINVEFKKGSTVDSNVIESGTTKDILDEVFGFDVAVGENLLVSPTTGKVCNGYTQYCQDASGKTGTQYCSKGVLQGESCVFDPKLTSFCSVCKSSAAK